MEDLLDDERIRSTIKEIEVDEEDDQEAKNVIRDKNEIGLDDFGNPMVNSPDVQKSQTTKHRTNYSINQRDSQLTKESLPPVGSFGLIKDIVRDYTELGIEQARSKQKHDMDSLRAFPGTKIAQDIKLSKDKVAWQDRKSRSMSMWGTEDTNKKKTLFRQKGLRDDGVGRFQTSTKQWLDGYDSVRERYTKAYSSENSRVNTAVGRAMFNLRRTMPSTAHADPNIYIRQNNITSR